MLAIDLLIIIGGAALVIAAGSAIGLKIDSKLKKRRQIKHGKENADKLFEEMVFCASCGKEVDMNEDVFNHGTWWHKECLKNVLTKENW